MTGARTVFVWALLLAAASCAHRAAVPPPRLPLAATPASALPEAPTEPWPEPWPDPQRDVAIPLERLRLDNGFELILAPTTDNGVVTIAFASRATPRWDLRAPPTVTTWTLALMGRATVTDEGVIDDLMVHRGFSPTTRPGASGLLLDDTVLREELPAYLRTLDQVLRSPAYRAEDLARQVEAESDRLTQRLGGSAGVLQDRSPSLLYDALDPRSSSLRDELEQIRSMPVQALRARHAQLLDPSRSTVVIVGDFDVQQAREIASARFGSWPANGSPPQVHPPRYVADSTAPRGLVVVRRALHAYLMIVERAPPMTHEDYPAFLAIEQLLGGMFSSRLNLAVREGSGASYGLNARYTASSLDGTVELVTSIEPAYSPAVLQLMIAELARVSGRAGGIEEAELALARTRAEQTLRARVDTSAGLALAIAQRVQAGRPPLEFQAVIQRIHALTRARVEAAARRWLRPDRAALLLVMRAADARRLSGFGPLETREIVDR